MWPVVVVGVGEAVEQCLEFGEGGGLGLGSEPFLEGLLEPFDFAAGGGVVRSAVLLHDAVRDEFGLEGVASAVPASEACGVDHAVVGQC